MTDLPQPRIDRDALLAHRPWVRALAVSLTRGAADADDVEQETWLATLDRAPADLRTPRAWFVTVARNAARKLARGDARRRRREESLVVPPPHPSAAELTAQAEAHRDVVAAVLALDDVHREAVLLRYFEGLPVRGVAARAGVPLETARARLRRARAKLREQLAEEHGGGDAWRLALVPLIGSVVPGREGGAAAAAAASGGALVASKTVVACGVALLLAGAAWWQFGGEDESVPVTDEASAAPAPAGDDNAPGPRPRASTERAAAPTEEPSPPLASPVPAPRVADAPRRTAAERLADPVEPIEFVDAPLPEALGRLGAETGVRIVLAKEVATRIAAKPPTVHLSFEGSLPGRTLVELAARTQGFDLEIEDDRVVVVPADGARDRTLEVVVVPEPSAAIPAVLVRGTVSDVGGAAVAGASIVRTADGRVVATSDPAGRFELRCRRPLPTVEARAEGRVASAARAVVLESGASPGVAQALDLVVGAASGSVVVRVTADGKPVAGAAVTVGEATADPNVLRGESVTIRRALARFTDDGGRATFEDVPPGDVPVVVRHPGSVDASQKARVVAGERTEVVVALVASPSLRRRLDATRVSFEFRDAAVQDVVRFLAQVSGTRINLRSDAFETAVTSTVTLSAKDLPLSQALKDLCDAAPGLAYELDEESGVVLIRKRAD